MLPILRNSNTAKLAAFWVLFIIAGVSGVSLHRHAGSHGTISPGLATIGVAARPMTLPVKVISTSNLTLSGAQTVDGVAVVAGDLVGAVAQSDNKSGAYVVAAGAWTPADPGVGTGLSLIALNGSSNANSVYGADTTGTIVWGTTSVTFTKKSSTGTAFDPTAPGAIGGTTPAAITGTVITATTRFTGPTIGPATGQQHTLPAVTSGTLLVSGASSITDATLQLGDATHRLTTLGVQALAPGAGVLTVSSTMVDSAATGILKLLSNQDFAAAGSVALYLSNHSDGSNGLGIGSPTFVQSDALCFSENLVASGAVTAGQVVVWSGTKQVAAAAASAGLTTIAGVAIYTVSSGRIDICRRGRAYVNSDAGTTAGQLLKTSGSVAGNVVNGGTAVGSIVGRACEATGGTVSGKVLVDLILS